MMAHPDESINSQIESLIKLGPWFKAVILGAFGIGVWVTTLQIQVSTISAQVGSLESSKKEREDKFDTWKESVVEKVTDLKAEVRGAREDISEIKNAIAKQAKQ